MTAVILRADAVLHADMRIRSSIKLSFTSSHADWMMKTSSSRTDSKILTLVSPLENFLTLQATRGTLSLYNGRGVGGDINHYACAVSATHGEAAHRSATDWASSGWLFPRKTRVNWSIVEVKDEYKPVRILIELV